MAALLASKVDPIAQEFINNVLISDLSPHDASTRGGDCVFEAGITHHGADNSFFGQRPLPQHIHAGDSQDIVTIDEFAGFVAEQDTIRITIMGYSDIRA